MLRTCFFVAIALALVWYAQHKWGKFRRWHIGRQRRLTDLELIINWTVLSGFDGMTVRLDRRRYGRGYVDLVKRLPEDAPASFEMVLHEDACTPEEYEEAKRLFERQGVDYQSETWKEGRRLIVEFGQDIKTGCRVIRAVFMSIWDAPADAMIQRKRRGVCHFVVVNGIPTWDDPSGRLGKQRRRQAAQGDKSDPV